MLLSANGSRVVECRLSLPRVGLWHADILVDDAAEIPDGIVHLSFEDAGITYVGGAVRQGTFANYLRVRLSAGSGQLWSTDLPPKAYRGNANPLNARLLIEDILATSGDEIDPTADAASLAAPIGYWVRVQQNALAALQAVIAGRAPSWRMTPAGRLWVGTDAYPRIDGTFDYQLIHERDDIGRIEIASAGPSLVPGVTFRGFRIGVVDHVVLQDSFRTVAYVE